MTRGAAAEISVPRASYLSLPKRRDQEGCGEFNLNGSHNNFIFSLMNHILALSLAQLISSVMGQCPSYTTKLCSFQFVGNDCPFDTCSIYAQEAGQAESTLQDWDLCLASCCDRAVSSNEHSLSSLRMVCPAGGQEDQAMSLWAFGFGLGLVLMLLIYCYCRGVDQIKRLLFRKAAQQSIDISILHLNNKELAIHSQIIKFLATEENVEHRQDRACSICLEDKTDVRASCGHEFHVPCITEWYKRKQECPQCRQSGTTTLTLLPTTSCHKESLVQTISVGDFASRSCS